MPRYEFGGFTLDTQEQRLTHGDQVIPLTPKVFETLELLVEARGRLVDRETFFARLWPDTVVEERNLAVNISTLRKALGDDAEAAFIETVPRHGYRLSVAVIEHPADNDVAANTPATSPFASHWSRRALRGAFVVGVVIGLVTLWVISQQDAAVVDPNPAHISLAVLPFTTIGVPEGDSYLSVGLADALITHLSQLPGLGVRPTSSIQAVKTDRDPVEVGRRLKVEQVLDAVIQQDADRMMITARLVDTASGEPSWTERFEQPVARLFELQDAVASRVAARLLPHLAATALAAAQPYRPSSPEAFRYQIEARARLNSVQRPDVLKALTLFQQAVAMDSRYALAHAGLASTYALLTSTLILRPLPVDEGMRLARESAERALALDDRLGEPHAVLGRVKFFYDWDWAGSEIVLRRAVSVGPTSPEAHEAYGWFLITQARFEDGFRELEQARALNPANRQTTELIGMARWDAGQPEIALGALAEAAALDPAAPRPHFRRMLVLEQMGRHADAMAARRQWMVLAIGPLARAHGPGDADRFQQIFDQRGHRAVMLEWIRLLEEGLDQDWEAADQWLGIGERERALDALERCERERCQSLPSLAVHRTLRPLRGEPRFEALLDRMKLRDVADRVAAH